MNHLPTPPDAYWATIPWWGYLGFVLLALLVLFVIGPWAIQRARGAPSATQSRERGLVLREDAERARLTADRDRGWDMARGCLPIMHQLWHDLDNVIQERNSLLHLCQRILDGRVMKEAARDRLLDFPDRKAPEPLPDLDGVEPKKAGETKYA